MRCAARSSSRPYADKHEAIVATEIPSRVNKARTVERIGELVRDKKIEGMTGRTARTNPIATAVASSSKLRRDAVPDVVLNQLYRFTALCDPRSAPDLVALDGGRPLVMNLKDADCLRQLPRGSDLYGAPKHLSSKAHNRAHILVGLAIRGRQYRRSDPPDPRRRGRQRGARTI